MKKFFKVAGFVLLAILSILPMATGEGTPFESLVRFIECWGIFWMAYYLIKQK